MTDIIETAAQAIYDQPTFDGDKIAVHLGNSMIINASTVNAEQQREMVMQVCRDAAAAVLKAIAGLEEPPLTWTDEAMAEHWIDRYAGGIDEEPQMDRILDCVGISTGRAA